MFTKIVRKKTTQRINYADEIGQTSFEQNQLFYAMLVMPNVVVLGYPTDKNCNLIEKKDT